MFFGGSSRVSLFALSTLPLLVACGPPTITYVNVPTTAVATPAGMPLGSNAVMPPEQREKLAVLPLEDERLFRSERSLLRFELTGHIARILPDRVIVPLSEVDAKIRPVSDTTGHLCAFEGEPIEQRARYKGWQTTRIMHVAGLRSGPGEALWVEILDGIHTVTTLEAPWNAHAGRVEAYRAAFASFVRKDVGGLLGGLGGRGSYEDALRQGSVTICETKQFGYCDKSSVDWQDGIAAVAACFAGDDEVTRDILVQGDVGPYCEMENLDFPNGKEAAREACLCKALGTSTAMSKRPGRRTIRVHYESPDIVGKTRPELRVIESSTNMHAEDDWHSMEVMIDGKKQYRSIMRLAVDNLDAVAAPLARCAVAPGNLVVADVELREDGFVSAGKVISQGLDKQTTACIEHALGRGVFNCTNDGKSARVRVGMEWRLLINAR